MPSARPRGFSVHVQPQSRSPSGTTASSERAHYMNTTCRHTPFRVRIGYHTIPHLNVLGDGLLLVVLLHGEGRHIEGIVLMGQRDPREEEGITIAATQTRHTHVARSQTQAISDCNCTHLHLSMLLHCSPSRGPRERAGSTKGEHAASSVSWRSTHKALTVTYKLVAAGWFAVHLVGCEGDRRIRVLLLGGYCL